MKLLLRRDIPKVGLAGEVVEVKEGYARNYLIPHHMGVEPTKANLKMVEEDKRRAEEERRQRRSQIEERVKRMHNVEVTIAAACNAEGHLYGSVGPREISTALRDEGHDVEVKQIQLQEPIKRLDTVTVPVIFADDLVVEVKVWVVRETASGDFEEEPREREPEQANRKADDYGYGNHIDALETDL
ncbi:MAG: 50S ribosomal protein L9 [Phycisphaerales bacterium]|nr:50S ribosomal protein L9 [Phycisphaerales bacterium]